MEAGRKHPSEDDLIPSYFGDSIGHWEGDTLVVDTVALHPASFIEGFTPHSDAMTVRERRDPGVDPPLQLGGEKPW